MAALLLPLDVAVFLAADVLLLVIFLVKDVFLAAAPLCPLFRLDSPLDLPIIDPYILPIRFQ